MKRYLGLESKSFGRCRWPSPPGLGTDSFGLSGGALNSTHSLTLLALEIAAWLPYGESH